MWQLKRHRSGEVWEERRGVGIRQEGSGRASGSGRWMEQTSRRASAGCTLQSSAGGGRGGMTWREEDKLARSDETDESKLQKDGCSLTASSSNYKKLLVACLLTVLTCSQGLLMQASEVDGGYPYDVAVIPFLAELVKLLLSFSFLYKQLRGSPPGSVQMTTTWKSMSLYPIPSVLYLIHNNIQFYTLQYVDAAMYQILGNLKIVTTGFLFRVFLRRHLSRTQWLALLLLTCGATTSQIQGCTAGCTAAALSGPLPGYMLGVLSAWLSAMAGVYTEFLMKKDNDALYWQNVQLYAFGVFFNGLRLTVDDLLQGFSQGFWWRRLTNGFTFITWVIVLNFSFAGLFVSWIMKYADTIVKVYATSGAMLLTAVLSIWGSKGGEDGKDEVRGGEVAEADTKGAVAGETRRGDSAGGNAGMATDAMEEHTKTEGSTAVVVATDATEEHTKTKGDIASMVATDAMEEHTETKGDTATAGRVALAESIVEATKADGEEAANRKGVARVTNGMEGVITTDEDAGAADAGNEEEAVIGVTGVGNEEGAVTGVVRGQCVDTRESG
ncbi:hypothetical protein CBR_g32154 [Chara braunii]|uniref:Uncharacterized protein n=1 Tax=Chara braunii TaxID=69332 RepID=A0A388JMW3_CHABU|nr:hypothetical protein CBR_g32154 [Chara braunii]|eukprot:GBG59137.1 hypothetical protein CBR_g32154 [Chara braunii]